MGKIGDLFVRLGLKKDEFDRGISDAQKQTEGFGNKLQGMKAGALAVWAAVGAAVGKFASDFVKETQVIGDRWDNAMAGLKAAYHQFIATISSGEGFDKLFHNLREASRLAREAQAIQDELFERKSSFGIEAADTQRQIAEQRRIQMDASKSEAERKAAAEKIIELTQKLADLKEKIWQDEATAARNNLKAATGLSDYQISYLVDNYNANRESIQSARNYMAKKAELENAVKTSSRADTFSGNGKSITTIEAEKALRAFESSANLNDKRIAGWLAKYDKSNDEIVKSYTDAVVAAKNVQTEAINGTIRATSFLGRSSKSGGSGSGSGNTGETPAPLDRSSMDVELKTARDLQAALIGVAVASKEMPDTITIPQLPQKDMSDTIAILQEYQDAMAQIGDEFYNAITTGFTDGIQLLTDGLMGLTDLNGGAVMQALIEPLADLAIKAGEITMESGLALTALGKALTNPTAAAPAIAAGAALIAVGAAAKSGLAALAAGTGGGTSSATTAQSSSTNSVYSEEIIVKVEGKISGSDILISGSRASKSWNR